jgi:hypothetical protein
MILRIDRTWDGEPIARDERGTIGLLRETTALHVTVDAPYMGDPAPPGPPGPTDRLWEHEVAELFILGVGQRYLEIEMGPHGHHLVLTFAGRRTLLEQRLPLDYSARIEGGRFRATARIAPDLLPPAASRVNAYLVHGVGAARRYLAAFPVPGTHPDFHRLDRFGPLVL